MDLGTRTSGADLRGATVLVPLGALEQHGAHLPLRTDSAVARAVSDAVAGRLDDRPVLVAPVVEYGASGEHEDFPGTVSIGTEALVHLVVELVRSVRRWCGPVVLVTGHGGNAEALDRAVGQLRRESHDVAWTSCAEPGWDAHAGRAETSLLLALEPDTVRMDAAAAGPVEPVAALLPRLRAGGVAAVSPGGVLGDPVGATAEEGEDLLERLVDRVTRQVRSGLVDDAGRLLRPTSSEVPA
ncbi:mycofactocin biosynthesis peptidyl-dipeptidase MftE [Phycicoccus sonneratiae]|uniref:Mycofactocin biosynthesis peptidyl-dipeptidase MftE n=1 Tax=Phycicoccus sonneratiae TaxID=2807628 RepID=A0ABS2CJQ4_9MICO|nr:mycofactocin biosynthesis peptidyl-dipeptidase MftE [Phycicoccus sonneraticus]MBM6400073.1 mycofactocin biosynthesis peptidyl-dipeptidase MftE [Phycicoccus sonneraticus]